MCLDVLESPSAQPHVGKTLPISHHGWKQGSNLKLVFGLRDLCSHVRFSLHSFRFFPEHVTMSSFFSAAFEARKADEQILNNALDMNEGLQCGQPGSTLPGSEVAFVFALA